MKYIAYGSNMVEEQMARRCPDARLIGMGYIEEARLEFYLHATVEKTGNKRNFTVPGIIDQLEMIECTRTAQNYYRRRYALTDHQKIIFNALGITEVELDQEVSTFNTRMLSEFQLHK